MNPAQLIDRIRQHGVNFDLTPERRTGLKAEKADDSVLDAMAKSKTEIRVACYVSTKDLRIFALSLNFLPLFYCFAPAFLM